MLDAMERRVMPDHDQALLVMVYSASIAIAEADRYSGYRSSYFLVRHGIFLAVGVGCAVTAFQMPLRVWQRLSPYLFLLGVALLVVVLYAADYTVRKAALMDSFSRGFLPMLIVMLLIGGLLLREPDFGAFAVIISIAMAILFLGGINGKQFAGLILMLLAGFLVLIWTSPYRMQRIIGFMDPWADPYGKGYQLSHALIAFGRGEWFGVGLGASVEKLLYLPEAHTDFLLAVIAEELGCAGVFAIIILFAWLTWRAHAIGRQAQGLERPFAALVAQGIGVWLAVQAIINMGVNMGLLPTKGLTLPLLSFGGSGIVANCVALAILLRVDLENRQLLKGYAA